MSDVTTTAGEPFTYQDSANLALAIYRRFGYDMEAARAAWSRMLQNDCSMSDFMDLLVTAVADLPGNAEVAHILKPRAA